MRNNLGVRLVSDGSGGFNLEFKSPERCTTISPAGRELRRKYLALYDDGHNRRFVFEKEIDQFARIQSFENSCLLTTIIGRATNGDPSALQKCRGMYCDTTGMPLDTRSALDLINKTRGVFDGLSKEEKARYHDDFSNFIGSFGSTAGIDSFVQARLKERAGAPTAPATAPTAPATAPTAPATAPTAPAANNVD